MQKAASKRVVSSWAAPLLSKLVQSAPVIVTEHSIVRFMDDAPSETPKAAIQRLVRLGCAASAFVVRGHSSHQASTTSPFRTSVYAGGAPSPPMPPSTSRVRRQHGTSATCPDDQTR